MDHLRLRNIAPVANARAVVEGDKYRFTVLTYGLIRYEWAPDGVFEDRASTFAIRRALDVPDFRVVDTDDALEIITKSFHLVYDKKEFSSNGLTVQVSGNITTRHSLWRYGVKPRAQMALGGTARTLDHLDGRCEVGPGVISRDGYSAIDDSRSMLFESDGWVSGRRPGHRVDGYLFAYGHEYRAAVQALYAISGSTPLLPRWALGNWWSRYYPYSGDEYLALMDRFKSEGIPLSVGVIDMDWHLVNDERVTNSGWTGYTWDPKLFPDPVGFLKELHSRDLKCTLNDHPADGIASFEEPYEEVAKALGRDTSHGDPVVFNITNRKFLDVYLNLLHRRLEEQGVDFWWIDWQSGEHSRTPGIDPLWMLNHFHYLDSARNGQRPLTFSRYAGPGSHRYPIGFSGDTVVSWASLDFQPEFTVTASNIGYGWWSHDVGGHLRGIKDDELTTRWVQLGVWSPVLRLHSTNDLFMTKEPWTFGIEARHIMIEQLRFRHRLMPYLHTMNVRAARDGEPLIQPLYWRFPKKEEAYRAKNQFFFGTGLTVAPITTPRDRATRLGRVRAFIPEGRHVDIFTGTVYDGDRELWLHRPLEGYPILAPEGAIIPLDAAAVPHNGCLIPAALEVLIVAGASRVFDILEDDGTGSSVAGVKWARTGISFEQETGVVHIGPTTPTTIAGLPEKRTWTVRFLALSSLKKIRVVVDGSEREVVVEIVSNGAVVHIGDVALEAEVTMEIGPNPQLDILNPATRIWSILDDAQIMFEQKTAAWKVVASDAPRLVKAGALRALDLDSSLLDAVLEQLLADSRELP